MFRLRQTEHLKSLPSYPQPRNSRKLLTISVDESKHSALEMRVDVSDASIATSRLDSGPTLSHSPNAK